ncbi:MAG TPA: GatB/YqeY domain-containing protein, partial [Pseudomonadales bacterium]
ASLKESLIEAMKAAMRAKDKQRLGVIRLALAAFKQIEVDERIELDEARSLATLDKMVKQRRDSINQYVAAAREDLAEIERYEITVLQEFLPQALSDEEISTIISAAIADTGAQSMADMGKVMAIVKPKVQGRADVGAVSKLVKQQLS